MLSHGTLISSWDLWMDSGIYGIFSAVRLLGVRISLFLDFTQREDFCLDEKLMPVLTDPCRKVRPGML